MTDILVRICVGACGLFAFASGMAGVGDGGVRGGAKLACLGLLPLGLITILRALGVL